MCERLLGRFFRRPAGRKAQIYIGFANGRYPPADPRLALFCQGQFPPRLAPRR